MGALKTYIRISLAVLGLLVSSLASAQKFSLDFWHQGDVVVSTGDTISGLIKYDLASGVIQLEYSNKTVTLAASKLKSFLIVDAVDSTERVFLVKEYRTSSDYKRPFIFELVSQGGFELLRREFVVMESRSSIATQGFNNSVRVIQYTHYCQMRGGEVLAVPSSRKKVSQLFATREKAMLEYMKSEGLHTKRTSDIKSIFAHYNNLVYGSNDENTSDE